MSKTKSKRIQAILDRAAADVQAIAQGEYFESDYDTVLEYTDDDDDRTVRHVVISQQEDDS